MKKIAGLLIGDECDQQLLGLDEKHDRLFIKMCIRDRLYVKR